MILRIKYGGIVLVQFEIRISQIIEDEAFEHVLEMLVVGCLQRNQTLFVFRYRLVQPFRLFVVVGIKPVPVTMEMIVGDGLMVLCLDGHVVRLFRRQPAFLIIDQTAVVFMGLQITMSHGVNRQEMLRV